MALDYRVGVGAADAARLAVNHQYAAGALGAGLGKEAFELCTGLVDGVAMQIKPCFPGDAAALQLAALR